MVSEKAKRAIDNLSESEIRLEIEKGRTSRFQRDNYAYLKVRLQEIAEQKDMISHLENVKEELIHKSSFFKRKWSDGEKWLMGIASALLTAIIIAVFGLLFSGDNDVQRTVSFETLPNSFGIRSYFSGTAKIMKSRILIDVKSAEFTLANPWAREVTDVRAVLAKPSGKGWEIIRTSERVPIGITLHDRETDARQNLEFVIPIEGLISVSGHYLVFDISETLPSDKSLGTSHAHTRPDLF